MQVFWFLCQLNSVSRRFFSTMDETAAERKAKAEENFKKWLQMKNQELQKVKARQATQELEQHMKKQLQEQRIEVAITEWNCKKVMSSLFDNYCY